MKPTIELVKNLKNIEQFEEFLSLLIDIFRRKNNIPVEDILSMLKRLTKAFEELKKELK